MIGIDDVAIRKGISYATAIYDLETHHLIALLEGREKDDIVPWLKAHPKIMVVARDRASSYAEAVSEVLPEAIQIADRFHLFENLIKYLKDMFYSEIPDKIVIKNNEVLDKKAKKVISELANIDDSILDNLNYNSELPKDKDGNIIEFYDYLYDMNDKLHTNQKINREEKYKKIICIRNDKNMSIEELSKKYNYCESSIKKYLSMSDNEVEQVKIKKNNKRKKMQNFLNI